MNIEPTFVVSLTVKDVAAALDFYKEAFGIEELFRMPMPDGSIAHAEFMIGNSHMYISNESPEWHALQLPEGVLASSLFAVNVKDCDAAYKQAVEAGGESLMEPEDRFWGMRTAMIKDSYGYRWNLRKKTKDLTPEEFKQRAIEYMASQQG